MKIAPPRRWKGFERISGSWFLLILMAVSVVPIAAVFGGRSLGPLHVVISIVAFAFMGWCAFALRRRQSR